MSHMTRVKCSHHCHRNSDRVSRSSRLSAATFPPFGGAYTNTGCMVSTIRTKKKLHCFLLLVDSRHAEGCVFPKVRSVDSIVRQGLGDGMGCSGRQA